MKLIWSDYGLLIDTSVVPPLIYAVMGTSREIAIGPVAVVSLLLPSMIEKLQDPGADPIAYRKLVLTATFFAGIFQATFGLFRSVILFSLFMLAQSTWPTNTFLITTFFFFQIYRLGFLVDFLSHAAIVGFVAGAAIVIGLQQLKGLLGISHFTNKTDVISVVEAVWRSVHHHVCSFSIFSFSFIFCWGFWKAYIHKAQRVKDEEIWENLFSFEQFIYSLFLYLQWSPLNFILGCSFLSFILITRFVVSGMQW